ncbi:MAG: hypothetical protein J3Q66DRAFT_421935 [Benniella sp.]|nr:MAG: hypothetical protein J3Q66DRAFT_421935 [Benniella sp.]
MQSGLMTLQCLKRTEKFEFELRKDVLDTQHRLTCHGGLEPFRYDHEQLRATNFTKEAHQGAFKGIVKNMLHALCPGYGSNALAIQHLKGLQQWIRAQSSTLMEPQLSSERRERGRPLPLFRHHVEESSAEHVFVPAWSHALNLLFDSNLVRGGGLESRRDMKPPQAKVGGRKGDVSIRVEWKSAWVMEIAVFEFKLRVSMMSVGSDNNASLSV